MCLETAWREAKTQMLDRSNICHKQLRIVVSLEYRKESLWMEIVLVAT